MSERASEARRFSRYATVGLISNGTVYLLFLILIWSGLQPIVASGMCYVVGLAISYAVHRTWTFRSQGSHASDLTRFLAAYGIGFLVTLMSMWGLVRLMRPEMAQILTIGITALAIYSSLRLLRFGQID